MDPAIRTEGLSKSYLLGAHQRQHETLGDALAAALRHPLRSLREAWARGSREYFWALKDLDLEVARGEVLGVIGRNGAGKSTLLKILSRITEPTRGRAIVRGRLTSLLEVGTGFHPELSGRENIFLNATILGMRRHEIARKLDEIVAFSGVERFLDTPVKHYSSGMYVRLAFAVAAHVDADILLVDEVLAVGDADFQRRCLGKMDEAAKGGRTVVFVSHNLTAVQVLCSRVLLLEAGAVTANGATGSVLREYLSGLSGRIGVVERDSGQLKLETAMGSAAPIAADQHSIRLSFRLHSSAALRDLTIDFGLETETGVRLAQIVPASRGEPPSHVAGDADFEYRVELTMTTLAPGRYFGTLYAHSPTLGTILHQSGIPLFELLPTQDAPECASSGFTALTLPGYRASIIASS